MSTIALPEIYRIPWYLHFADGDVVSSDDVLWDELAKMEEVDGMMLLLTTRKVVALELCPKEFFMIITPPVPTHFFGFTRVSQPLETSVNPEPFWLYSSFGYLLPDFCLVVKVYPPPARFLTKHLLLPRPMQFPL